MLKAHRKTQLSEIASIRLGYPFRTRIERDPKGIVGAIQMKDIDDRNEIDLSDVYPVDIDDMKEALHLLQAGDILFRSRGTSNTAAIVTDAVFGSRHFRYCVAAAPLMVISAKRKQVEPAYLQWYINHPDGQRQISRLLRGTSQQMVSKAALETLEVIVPPISTQLKIMELAALYEQEERLMEQLRQKRRMQVEAVLLNLARGKLI